MGIPWWAGGRLPNDRFDERARPQSTRRIAAWSGTVQVVCQNEFPVVDGFEG